MTRILPTERPHKLTCLEIQVLGQHVRAIVHHTVALVTAIL